MKLILRRWFIRLLIASALFLWLLTVIFTQPGHPEPSPYWYVRELHLAFWPGILCSLSALLLSMQHGKAEKFICIFLPILYLYSLPSIVHDMPTVFDIYHVIPGVLSIMRTGAMDLSRTIFPLSHIYYASSMLITDMAPLDYVRLYPTILASGIVLIVYTAAKRIWEKGAVIAPLAFLSLNWYMEYHMARQAFGVLIWAVFWLLVFFFLETRSWKFGVLAGIVLFSIIPAHPGMIIIVAFNLMVLAALVSYAFVRKRSWFYIRYTIVFPVIFLVGLAAAYYALPEIKLYLTSIYEGTTAGGFQGFSMGGPASASPEYTMVNRIRMTMGVAQSVIGLAVIVLYARLRKGRAMLLCAWFLGCYFWLGYSLTHNGYLIERAFLTALVPASILIAMTLKPALTGKFRWKRYLQIASISLLVFFLISIPITKNSVDAMETPSKEAYSAGRFAQNNMEGRVNIMDTHEGLFRYLESTHNSTVSFRSGRSGIRDDFDLGMTFGYHLPSTTNFRAERLLFTDYFNNYILIRYDNETAVEEIHIYEEQFGTISNRVFDSGGSRIYSRG